MKTILLITIALFNLTSFAQDADKKIKKIETLEQANIFIKENPKLKGEIIEINAGTDSSELSKKIIASKAEGSITIDGNTYRVMDSRKSFLLKLSYINLLAENLSLHQIDSIRKVIIAKYKSGATFASLAKQYNTDGNPNTELGWFSEDMFVPEFAVAIKEHRKDELFTIDLPCKTWYYVILKTGDDRVVKVYSVLKIESGK
jgi:hypothetical protein